MNNLCLMNRKVTNKMDTSIRKFCSPLIDHFGLSHFYHFLLTDSGGYAAGGLNRDWHDCFFSENLLLSFLPEYQKIKGSQGRVIFHQAFQNKNMQKILKRGSDEFKVNLGLHLGFQTDDGHEAFGFGLKTQDPVRHMALLNELPLINMFINEYRKKFQISYLKDNLVPITIHSNLLSTETPSSPLLKVFQTTPRFTKRENDVIRHLLNGCTAYEISKKLYLSKRTVEHYLERMKEKLDCCSKSELIQKARKLHSLVDLFN